MELKGKSSAEIQQQIFDEIRNGTSKDVLVAELKHNGLHPEGYYFTTEESYKASLAEVREPAPSSGSSGKQTFWLILTLVFLVIKVVRCSMIMNR